MDSHAVSNDEQKREYSFAELKQLVLRNDSSRLKYLFLIARYLAIKPGPKGGGLLHVALKHNNKSMVELILEAITSLGPDELKKALNVADISGKRPLHMAAQYCDYKTFSFLSARYGNAISTACLNITNDAELPLHLLEHNSHADVNLIRTFLETHTLLPQNQSIKDTVAYHHLSEKYKNEILKHQELSVLLDNACQALTYARKIINASSAHPVANELSAEEQQKLNTKVWDTKDQCDYLNELIEDTDFAATLKKINNAATTIKASGVGNCREYSLLIIEFLLNLNKKIPAQLFEIANGDHAFVVYGQLEGIADYQHWQKAIIIDGLNGLIFLPHEIPKLLKDHIIYRKDKNYNINVPFDDKIHAIRPNAFFAFDSEYLDTLSPASPRSTSPQTTSDTCKGKQKKTDCVFNHSTLFKEDKQNRIVASPEMQKPRKFHKSTNDTEIYSRPQAK